MKRYLDVFKDINFKVKGDIVSSFDYLKSTSDVDGSDLDKIKDVFGVDESSKTAYGYTIFADNYFIRDLENDIKSLNITKTRLASLVDRFKYLFNSSTDGILTPSNKRVNLFSGTNGIEVRVGRLEGDAPYRCLQTVPDSGKNIALSHLFQHDTTSNSYSSNLQKFDREIKKTNFDVSIESSLIDDVVAYLSKNNFNCTDYIKNIINDYIKNNNVKSINSIKYKLDNIINNVKVDELSDLGFTDDDIGNEVNRILNEKYQYKLGRLYLTEANRQQLLQKSRNAQHYKNMSKGKNRYERRMKSKISATVRDYNNIDMDQLFKRDIFEIKIPVMGETDVYEVSVKIEGLLKEVQRQVLSNKGKLEFKVILQSLMKVLNIGNVYIGCTCPDAKYRMAYWQTRDNYKAGYREIRPSNVTNPNDTLGAGCKHVMLILSNLDWCVKVASVINNYIKYCQEHLEQLYADYIFPKIYGIKYQKAVQMSLFHDGMLPNDKQTMDQVIQRGMQGKDAQGKFVKDNPYKFNKKEINEPQEDENQIKLNFDEPTDKELKSD